MKDGWSRMTASTTHHSGAAFRAADVFANAIRSMRQQAAVLCLIGLLRTLNGTLSEALDLDFAQFAAPPRAGGCCG